MYRRIETRVLIDITNGQKGKFRRVYTHSVRGRNLAAAAAAVHVCTTWGIIYSLSPLVNFWDIDSNRHSSFAHNSFLHTLIRSLARAIVTGRGVYSPPRSAQSKFPSRTSEIKWAVKSERKPAAVIRIHGGDEEWWTARVTEKRKRQAIKTRQQNEKKEHRILWCATVQHPAIEGNAVVCVCVLKLNNVALGPVTCGSNQMTSRMAGQLFRSEREREIDSAYPLIWCVPCWYLNLAGRIV